MAKKKALEPATVPETHGDIVGAPAWQPEEFVTDGPGPGEISGEVEAAPEAPAALPVTEVAVIVPLAAERRGGGYCPAGPNLTQAQRETLRDLLDALVDQGAEIVMRPARIKPEDGEMLNADGVKVFVKAGEVIEPEHRRKVERVDHAIGWLLERIEAERKPAK